MRIHLKADFITLLLTCSFLSSGLYADTVAKETVMIEVPEEDVWAAPGDFCDLSWHPLVDNTVCNAEGTVRNVILLGGAGVVEELINQPDDRKYVYNMIDQCTSFEPDGTCNSGPVLPVANYKGDFKVLPLGQDSTIVMWQTNFDQLNEDAEMIVRSLILRLGLDALKADLEATH